MHPYRKFPMRAEPSSSWSPEEPILYALFVAIGAIPIAIALDERAAFGVEATVGLIMMCAGVLGALGYVVRVLHGPDRVDTAQPAGPSGAGSRSR
jgi:hypothetical protein